MEKLNILSLYVEAIAAIVALIYYRKYKSSYLKYFLFFLWYVVINECLGRYMSTKLDMNNNLIFNLYIFINFIFLFSIYRHYIKKQRTKQYITIFICVYIITLIFSYFFLNENYATKLQVVPFIVGACFLVISVIFYFIEILKSEKILLITRNLLFWISVGILLFNVGAIPILIVREYDTGNKVLIQIIFLSLVILLNICYITGFIISNKIKESE